MRLSPRRLILAILLLCGEFVPGSQAWREPTPWLILAIAAAILPFSQQIQSAADRLAAWLAPRAARAAIAVALVVAAFFLCQAWHLRDQLFIRWQDEYSYLLQARMLAIGRLWMPGFPPGIGKFFDSSFLTVDRVYASIYFPGTALLMTPTIWLHLPFWLMPALIASAAAAFFYLVLARIFNPMRALIAVPMLVCLLPFRDVAMMVLSESPFLLAEMVLLWSWLRWRDRPDGRWAWLIGAAAGYAAITRPVDALCYSLPVGIAMICQLLPAKKSLLLPTLAKLILAASPFLAIQIIQNLGITGRWDATAEGQYVQQHNPAGLIGFFKIDPANVPQSTQPQRQQEMKQLLLPAYQQHRWQEIADWGRARLARTYEDTLPHPMLAFLIPAALLSMRDPRRRVIVASLILFMFFYALNPFYLDHYTVAIICPMVCLIFMAWDSVETAWPTLRPMIGTFMTALLLMLSIPTRQLDLSAYSELQRIDRTLQALPNQPALVLFRFDSSDPDSYKVEPVFNASVVFPDQATIVRAHDLGDLENRQLYQYYAARQPARIVYIYDRSAPKRGQNPLSPPLGTVAELAAQ